MSRAQMTALWQQINRTARPGARVIFRTAGEETHPAADAAAGDLLDPGHYDEAPLAGAARPRPLGDLWRLPPLPARRLMATAIEPQSRTSASAWTGCTGRRSTSTT